MCGITGFIDFSGQSPITVLDQMTDSLEHRGPDGRGIFLTDDQPVQIGLGHRRLAILDLTELGKQPMQFLGYTIVFNGEIYNFREIRADLEKCGHQFTSDSDTEVILHAYHEWQEDCLSRFIGMFALVIFDREKQEVFCARDRAGVKPFFYYQEDGLFLFASELKAFHHHPRFEKQLNRDALNAFLRFGNVPAPHCIFKHTYKLNPGHFLTINLRESVPKHLLKQVQYWNVYDAYNQPKRIIDPKTAILETEKLLTSAFEYRMVSDVPVGVFLSGGYDSACVTALLQKDRTQALNTYTIGVPDIGMNEAPFAKEVAGFLGTNHHEYQCTEAEALGFIPELGYYYDEPFADSSAIPTMLVSKMAKKDVTVALSADGGDEVFGGYNRYQAIMKYGNTLNKIPGFAQRSMAAVMQAVPAEKIPYFNRKYNFAQRYEKIREVLASDLSSENIMLSLAQVFNDAGLKKLLVDEGTLPKTNFHSRELTNHTPLSAIMAIDYQTYLPDDILQKVDRASMHTGLESREPFLDHRVIEWVAQLPDDLKYRNGEKKWLLKEIVHQYIPKTMMDRPKTGFAIPLERWLQNGLRDLVETHLSEAAISNQGLFNYGEINRLKTAFFNGRTEYGLRIWHLLSFQLWYEKWMN